MLRNNPVLSDFALFMIVFLIIAILFIILCAVIYHLVTGNGPKDYAHYGSSSPSERIADAIDRASRDAYINSLSQNAALHNEMQSLHSSGGYTPYSGYSGIDAIGHELGETASTLGDFASDMGKSLVDWGLGR